MTSKMLRLRPPRIAATLMITAAVLYWIAPILRLSYGSHPISAVIFVGTGFAVMVWGWNEFRRIKNPICQTPIAAALIRTGAFRYSRNPMYLGMLMMMLSPSIWLGSPFLLLPTVVFFSIMRFVFIPQEESRLRCQFKDVYDNYQGKVRRWI